MKFDRFSLVLFTVLLAACGFSACSDDNSSSDNDSTQEPVWIFDDFSDAQKDSLPVIPVKSINDMGQWASDIHLFGDYAYVVDSGNNAIHRIHLADLSVDKNYVDLGQNASPYAAYADEKSLYVAVQGKQSVIAYPHDNLASPQVIKDNLVAPTAIYSHNDMLLIADSEYDYNDATKTGGKIYVQSDKTGLIQLISSSQNPGFLDYCPTNEWIFSINSGVISFYPETTPPEKSCLDVWDAKNLSAETENKPIYSFCVDHASLGRTTKHQNTLYVGDALKPIVHVMVVEDMKKTGTAFTELVLSEESSGLTVPVDMGSMLGIIEYNHDMLYLTDGTEIKSYRLSKSDVSAKGPIDAVYDSARKQLLILNSNAGSVDVLKLQ